MALVVGGLLLAWQNFLTKEKEEHPTPTEVKYFGCMTICDIEFPNLDDTQADSLTKFMARKENEKCQASCREKYGISLPVLPKLPGMPE